ncbi:hypothetical protein P8452_47623 [Trifolium repens]|nr:hypothetical protein P8452_47623 [Trifolium repens]
MAGGDKDTDNRRMKLKSASARRANAAENPHIKQARKKGSPSKSDAAPSTAGLEPQPQPESQNVAPQPQPHPESQDVEPQSQPVGDVDPAGDVEPNATGEPANVVEEMELEEAMTEGEGGGPNRRNVWTDPYEGLPVPDVFPGGSFDTTVLTSYPRHVARYRQTILLERGCWTSHMFRFMSIKSLYL